MVTSWQEIGQKGSTRNHKNKILVHQSERVSQTPPHTCYCDEATLTDIDNMISGDGLSVCRLGIGDKGTDAAPCCQDIPSSHWQKPKTRKQKYECRGKHSVGIRGTGEIRERNVRCDS